MDALRLLQQDHEQALSLMRQIKAALAKRIPQCG